MDTYQLLWRYGVNIQISQRAVYPQGQTKGHQASKLHFVLMEVQPLNQTTFSKELSQRHSTLYGGTDVVPSEKNCATNLILRYQSSSRVENLKVLLTIYVNLRGHTWVRSYCTFTGDVCLGKAKMQH